MTVTVWGDAGGVGTQAAHYDRYGRLTEASSYGDLEPELPTGGIEIDCDHDQRPVGQLLYVELGDDERLRAVAVIDGDWLEQVEQPVFFSPMLEMRGGSVGQSDTYSARTAEMLGLSITLETARLGAHPLGRRSGDLRNSNDRFSKWPGSWESSDPLLARALDHLGNDWQVRTRSASQIVDKRMDAGSDYNPMWRLRAGDYVPLAQRGALDLPGGLRRSPHLGRIISVR